MSGEMRRSEVKRGVTLLHWGCPSVFTKSSLFLRRYLSVFAQASKILTNERSIPNENERKSEEIETKKMRVSKLAVVLSMALCVGSSFRPVDAQNAVLDWFRGDFTNFWEDVGEQTADFFNNDVANAFNDVGEQTAEFFNNDVANALSDVGEQTAEFFNNDVANAMNSAVEETVDFFSNDVADALTEAFAISVDPEADSTSEGDDPTVVVVDTGDQIQQVFTDELLEPETVKVNVNATIN